MVFVTGKAFTTHEHDKILIPKRSAQAKLMKSTLDLKSCLLPEFCNMIES